MMVMVRTNGALAEKIGTTRLRLFIELADETAAPTIADVITQLNDTYPHAAIAIKQAIPFVSGRHLDPTTTLKQGQEIALLMPAAGG